MGQLALGFLDHRLGLGLLVFPHVKAHQGNPGLAAILRQLHRAAQLALGFRFLAHRRQNLSQPNMISIVFRIGQECLPGPIQGPERDFGGQSL